MQNYGRQQIIRSHDYGMTIEGIYQQLLTIRITSIFWKKYVETKNLRRLKCPAQHFHTCFSIQEDAIFKIHFLLCEKKTD